MANHLERAILCHLLMCCAYFLLQTEFMALCTVLILWLVQELFLSFLVYFVYFNSQLPVVTQGQYPVSGAQLNELIYLW
jgi:hypothetical protein